MKRTLLVFLLVNLLLSACAPVSAPMPTPTPSATPLPTATAVPTSTATPTSTPTAIPTATPTPIPTIQVGDLSVPDPRITNPELFDLRNPDAPIPQFANALKNAGIELSPEQIVAGITYVSTKADGAPLVDKNGNPFVVAIYNLDSSLFPKQYRDLAGPIPLMIAEKGENGWGWKEIGLNIGISDSITSLPKYRRINPRLYEIFRKDANRLVIGDLFMINPYDDSFSLVTSTKKISTNKWENTLSQLRQEYPDKEFLFFHVLWGHPLLIPKWLQDNSLNREERISFIETYVTTIMPLIGNNEVVLVNEPFTPNWNWAEKRRILNNIFGKNPDEWIPWVFELANKANPNAKLILNEFGIEASGSILFDSPKADKTFNIIKEIKERNPSMPVAIGFQMHINPQFQELDTLIKGFISQIKRYQSIGVPVIITELDIRMDGDRFHNLSENERLLIQAKYYYHIAKICNQHEIQINLFGASDRNSWLEERANGGEYAELTDPTVREEDYSPKLSWFELNKAFWESQLGN